MLKKYVGVQSWKAMHLPTLDIRVEQEGNRVIKWKIHFCNEIRDLFTQKLYIKRHKKVSCHIPFLLQLAFHFLDLSPFLLILKFHFLDINPYFQRLDLNPFLP